MRDRLKILDCNRLAVLKLPDTAFRLWFCYYMNEDEGQESFMSLNTIEEQLDFRMSRRSIITWTAWLLRTGWLVDTGRTAADKWLALGKIPTRGSYQIHVYRVDDPISAKSALEEKPINNEETVSSANSAPVQIAPKVYYYGSGSVSSSGYQSQSDDWPSSTSVSMRPRASNPVVEPKPQTNSSRKSLAPDGTPWSEWDAHDQVWKTAKLIEHGHTKPGVTTSVPRQNQREKPTGLAAFLAEGNPIRISESNYSLDDLGDDPNFVPRCAYKHGTKRCWNAGEFDGYCSEHAHLEV